MKTGFTRSLGFKAGLLSALILAAILAVWHVATLSGAPTGVPAVQPALTPEQIEYAKLMGKDPAATAAAAPSAKSGFPTLAQMGAVIAKNLASPFYDNGPNDKGVGLQLAYSLGRVGLGYLLAALVAIPLGFVIGMSPLVYRALDPFIQVLKPISPLAWMPLALYTIKDSSVSGIFVIFICSVWPMLINTAFGVAGVRREWLNVAKTLEVSPLRKAFEVILPAAAPTILTGMRISMGIAWLVIVAAEMLVGGTGIGYFVWNEWNNLSLPNVIFAIFVIGVVGMLLDMVFARLQKAVTYVE
jgi:nitrate/nitrite transport system permease protein